MGVEKDIEQNKEVQFADQIGRIANFEAKEANEGEIKGKMKYF